MNPRRHANYCARLQFPDYFGRQVVIAHISQCKPMTHPETKLPRVLKSDMKLYIRRMVDLNVIRDEKFST